MAERVLATPSRDPCGREIRFLHRSDSAQVANHQSDLFRIGAASSVANNQPAHFLAYALIRHLVEVVQAALAEIRVARIAVFAAAATGIHGVFQINYDFQAVVCRQATFRKPSAGFLPA